ncbi:MAG: DUF5320 domain-containing protein [Thermoplasmata archaeon]|nr:DUF5320 domain-containing protein [Thermoplasmata archaeon]
MYGPGWYGGRGRGWGATLGYCPWTGLPRGWRWNYPYQNYTQYPWNQNMATGTNYGFQPVDEKTALENELKYLQERMNYIRKRLEDLEK